MRVSEVYTSVQGEGPNVGRTTVFVRFGGCNLRCPGWPCDTVHAIDPAYRFEWKKQEPGEVYQQIVKEAQASGAKLVTLTGGEPFLQKNSELEELVTLLCTNHYEVEAFTNGTIEYPEWAVDNVSMIMDWKLPGSGEDPYNATRLKNIEHLDEALLLHSVKFVCKDAQDFATAHELWQKFLHGNGGYPRPFNVFYGKVWDGNIVDADLAKLVMGFKLPWRMNVQLHNYIWDPQERGR